MDFDVQRSRATWWAVGGLLGLALLFVLYSFVGTFVFGVFLYYATRPGYNWIRRRVGRPGLSAALALCLLALPVVFLLAYTIAIAIQELSNVAATSRVSLGPYEEVISSYANLTSVVDDPASLLQDPNVTGSLTEVLDTVLQSLGFIGTGLLHLFVMFALAYYMLKDGPRLAAWSLRRFGDDRGVLETYVRAVDGDLKKVFSGTIYNALFTAAIGAIVYSVLNVFAPAGLRIPYPALVGVLAGAASLVPVVGMKLVYFPVSAYLFAVTFLRLDEPVLWFPAVFVAVSFVIVDTIPDLLLRPYVSGRNLHVGLVMLAYIFGPLMFGWYGIFLGPILLVLLIHFARQVLPELLQGTQIQPFAVDPSNLIEPDPAPEAPDEPAEGPSEDATPS